MAPNTPSLNESAMSARFTFIGRQDCLESSSAAPTSIQSGSRAMNAFPLGAFLSNGVFDMRPARRSIRHRAASPSCDFGATDLQVRLNKGNPPWADWTGGRSAASIAAGLRKGRLQAHYAVQFLGRAGRAYVPPQPDDSHTNMGWDDMLDGFTTHGLKGDLRLGLKIADLTLVLFGGGIGTRSSLSVERPLRCGRAPVARGTTRRHRSRCGPPRQAVSL